MQVPEYEGDGRPVAFISGRITGEANYKEKFLKAQKTLEQRGHIVLNPAFLPVGMEYHKYQPIDDAMLMQADIMFVIDKVGEAISSGVAHEVALAKQLFIPCQYL